MTPSKTDPKKINPKNNFLKKFLKNIILMTPSKTDPKKINPNIQTPTKPNKKLTQPYIYYNTHIEHKYL
jgi:hypothetical protein